MRHKSFSIFCLSSVYMLLPAFVFAWFCKVAWYWAYAANLATKGCFCRTLAFFVGGLP